MSYGINLSRTSTESPFVADIPWTMERSSLLEEGYTTIRFSKSRKSVVVGHPNGTAKRYNIAAKLQGSIELSDLVNLRVGVVENSDAESEEDKFIPWLYREGEAPMEFEL